VRRLCDLPASRRREVDLQSELSEGLEASRVPAFVPPTNGRSQETVSTAEQPNAQVSCPIRASAQVARSAPRTLSSWRHGFEPRWDYRSNAGSEEASPSLSRRRRQHLLLMPLGNSGRWISLIRYPQPTRATPPHPPNGIEDADQLDAREDPSLRSATHTTSSLVPEGRPLLRSAWPNVAPGTSTCPHRRPHEPASCRRAYPSRLTHHPIDASHHWNVGTGTDNSSCHGN